MSRRNKKNQNNNNNQYFGNNQYYNQYPNSNNQYNGQYYNQNGQYYNQNGQYYNQGNQYYNQNGQYYNQGTQYYNQNQYQQYNNGNVPKKTNNKIDKKLIIGISLFVIFAIVLIIVIVWMNNSSDNEEEKEPDVVEKEPDYEEGLTMTVGSDEYGYVNIPSNWVKFVDEVNVNSLQYSDVDATYIVTLNYTFTNEKNAIDYADTTYKQLQELGVSNLSNTKVKINNYEGYKITGFYKENNIWLSVWIFEAEDGKTHYVGVEGPDNQSEYFSIIDTFKTTK